MTAPILVPSLRGYQRGWLRGDVLAGDGSRVWVDRDRHPDSVPEPGFLVVRVEAGLFFAHADHVRDRIRSLVTPGEVRAVVLDAETVPFVDVTAAEMLVELSRDLESDSVKLLLARDIGQVRDVLRSAGTDEQLYPTVEAALAADGGRHGARDQ